MPNIKPISDLRNYTDVLKEVDLSNRVYLTRNGHGEYAILTMDEVDELDRIKAAYLLLSKLQNAEKKADKEGWVDADALEKELGVDAYWVYLYFYRVENNTIYITALYSERENFIQKMFGISLRTSESLEFWGE